MIKNGAVLETLQYANAAPFPHSFLQVNFESESQPTGRDNPRGYRPWAGTLEVSGARLVGVSTPGFQDLRTEWARRDENNGNKIDFNTATRGRTSNIVLVLDEK
ncbi:MAG: hypothetical protein IID18_01435 [Nitrospinae bacterium]|nr:hypothetical protein [Nitrospinota bacterium]